MKELVYRKLLADQLIRGKVDFNLSVEYTGSKSETEINKGIIEQYMAQLASIAPEAQPVQLLDLAMKMPDVLTSAEDSVPEAELNALADTIQQAATALVVSREKEGAVLQSDFEARVTTIQQLLEEVIALDKERLALVRTRLEKQYPTYR